MQLTDGGLNTFLRVTSNYRTPTKVKFIFLFYNPPALRRQATDFTTPVVLLRLEGTNFEVQTRHLADR